MKHWRLPPGKLGPTSSNWWRDDSASGILPTPNAMCETIPAGDVPTVILRLMHSLLPSPEQSAH
jgi:hypothetical protein